MVQLLGDDALASQNVDLPLGSMKQEQLVERMQEKFDLNLHEVQGEVTTINITTDGQTTSDGEKNVPRVESMSN